MWFEMHKIICLTHTYTIFLRFSCVYLSVSVVSQFIFLGICVPHCLPPPELSLSLSLCQFHCLYLWLSAAVDLSLSGSRICNAKLKQDTVSWL